MRPGYAYNAIETGYPYRLRGTNQQTDTGLIWQTPGYKAWPAGGGASTTFRMPGLGLGYYALHNRSGSTVVAAIGVRIPNALWIAGQWTDATTTFTDDTTDAQDAGTDDFALETTTTNDGFIIASRVPFNAISFNVTTASVDAGTVTRAVRFSNAAGTGWQTAESNLFIHDGSATNYATGENIIAFAAPTDWGKSSSLATGLRDGFYTMNVRATDAPATTAGLAATIEVFRLYFLTEGLTDNSTLYDDFGGGEILMASDTTEGMYGDALVALFGTANDQNGVFVNVRPV